MITLTEDEAKLVVQLCDLALKQGGLAAVNAVVPLAMKCQQQPQQKQQAEQQLPE